MDFFTTNQFTIQTMAVSAILAFSVQVPMRAGTFSLAGIGFYGIGSYTAAYFTKEGHPAIVGIGIGLLISVVLGWVLARLLVRLRDLYLAMATIAFDLLVGVVVLNWKSVTGGPEGLYAIPTSVSMNTILITLVVVVVVLAYLEWGVIGRIFEASREDDQVAQSLSISVKGYRQFAFVVSAFLGALAGSFHSLSSFAINPTEAGFDLVILVVAMVVVGGFSSWAGALLGAVLLIYVPIGLSGLGESWPVIYGVSLVLFAVYVPMGIYGVARSLVRRLPPARRSRAVQIGVHT